MVGFKILRLFWFLFFVCVFCVFSCGFSEGLGEGRGGFGSKSRSRAGPSCLSWSTRALLPRDFVKSGAIGMQVVVQLPCHITSKNRVKCNVGFGRMLKIPTDWLCSLSTSRREPQTLLLSRMSRHVLTALKHGTASLANPCTNQAVQRPPQTPHSQPQANLLSLNTSCISGTSAPVPGFGCLSRRDNAEALAALQAKILLHLGSHAAFTRFWKSKGTDRA